MTTYQIQMRYKNRPSSLGQQSDEALQWIDWLPADSREEAIRIAQEQSATSSSFIYRALAVEVLWSAVFVEGERLK